MRVLIENYLFDKVTKQVTFDDYVSITLENVLLITDVTNNLCIYQANNPGKGGAVTGNVLTLDFNTNVAEFANTDKLQIFYEQADSSAISGSVDVTSVPAPLNVIGSGAAASALRVQLADESLSAIENINVTVSNSAVEITNDAGNPIPVSGTIVAQVSGIAEPDVLGTAVSGSRNNQIEINFSQAVDVNLITNTTAGGGSISITNGHSLYSTGASATASAKGVSVKVAEYRPAHEIYAYFSAAFTTPTSANSYQRIGLFDVNNGFFIGFEGTAFGITRRFNGVDTFISDANFNADLLNGGGASNFKRNGTAEALNTSFSNLFRIRFAWLGSASIKFEVFSPDGVWVNFHTIKQPNSTLNPSITNPDLPMAIDIAKSGADATNLVMATACWAAGTTSDFDKITATITDYTLASLSRSVITGRTTAGGSQYVNVKVTPSGSLTTAIGDITGVVGQNTMANSLPVTIASNQTAVPASQSGTWNINNISGTVSLPTGAATIAKQDTIIGHLDGVEGLLTTSNTNTSAISTAVQLLDNVVTTHDAAAPTNSYQVSGFASASAPTAVATGDAARIWTTTSGAVNIADAGGSITVDGIITANLGTIAGVATETTLSSLNVKVPTQGQKTMAGSLPVVLSSDQSAVPVSGTVTANIGTTNGLALNTTVDSLLKPASTLSAVTTLGSITNTVVIKADTAANQGHALKVDGSAVTQPISGSVSITGTPIVSVSNFPAIQAVSATNLDIRDLTSSDVVTVTGGAGQTADIKVTLDGEQVAISNFPATQAISGTVSINSIPAGNNNIGDVDIASLPAPLNIVGVGTAASALRVQLADESLAALENITVDVGTVEISNDAGNPIPISATALPLPTGASSSAKQDTIIGHLDGVEGLLTTIDADTGSILTAVQLLDDVVATDGAAALTKAYQVAGTDGTNAQIISTNVSGHVNIADGGNSITVDGTVAATQSGTWTITNISGTVTLPTGASTSSNQTTMITALQLLDDVVATDGSAALTKGYQVAGTDGTNAQIISTNTSGHINIADGGNSITVDGTVAATQSGTWNINAITTLPSIPAGNNNIGDVDIASLPAPLNVIGAGVAASALRVHLSSESLAALENINVIVSNSAVEITNDAGNPIPVSGTVTANTGLAQPLTDTQLRASAVPVSAAALPLPTGAATSANQTNGTQRTQLTDGTSNVAVTDAVPGASAVGLVVRNIPSGTQPVTGSVDVDNLPAPLSLSGAGAATGALRVQLSDDSLATFANLNVTLANNGVVIENDAGNPVPVSQNGTWNIESIANSLPSGDNNIGNVDVATLPGTVQADIGAIKTAVEATNAKTTGPVALRFDNSADPVAYKGEATAGTATSAASWRISRITTANDGSVTIEWVDGNTNFDNIWNNRASLSYS